MHRSFVLSDLVFQIDRLSWAVPRLLPQLFFFRLLVCVCVLSAPPLKSFQTPEIDAAYWHIMLYQAGHERGKKLQIRRRHNCSQFFVIV